MAVVVSAMGGKPKVTDLLLNSVSLAAAGNREGSEVRTSAHSACFIFSDTVSDPRCMRTACWLQFIVQQPLL